MTTKRRTPRSIVETTYNYVHSSRNEERIRFAVKRLNQLIVADGIQNSKLTRFQFPSTNAFSPPNCTPESQQMRSFLLLRDSEMFAALEDEYQQDLVHRMCLETAELSKSLDYANAWMKKSKVKRGHRTRINGSNDFVKSRLLNAKVPVGVSPKRTRIMHFPIKRFSSSDFMLSAELCKHEVVESHRSKETLVTAEVCLASEKNPGVLNESKINSIPSVSSKSIHWRPQIVPQNLEESIISDTSDDIMLSAKSECSWNEPDIPVIYLPPEVSRRLSDSLELSSVKSPCTDSASVSPKPVFSLKPVALPEIAASASTSTSPQKVPSLIQVVSSELPVSSVHKCSAQSAVSPTFSPPVTVSSNPATSPAILEPLHQQPLSLQVVPSKPQVSSIQTWLAQSAVSSAAVVSPVSPIVKREATSRYKVAAMAQMNSSSLADDETSIQMTLPTVSSHAMESNRSKASAESGEPRIKVCKKCKKLKHKRQLVSE